MPDTKRPLKAFLCHAHADREPVRALYTRLVKDGVDAWFDKEKLLPGQDWELEIRKAVREADVVVVCLSKQFNQAGFRQKEVRLALDTAMEKPEGEIFIIPARLDECDTPDSLQKWHWVNLFEDDGYDMLVRTLRVRAEKIGVRLRRRRNGQTASIRTEKNKFVKIPKKSDGTVSVLDENVNDSKIENSIINEIATQEPFLNVVSTLQLEMALSKETSTEKVDNEVTRDSWQSDMPASIKQISSSVADPANAVEPNQDKVLTDLKPNVTKIFPRLKIVGFVGIAIIVLGLGFWGSQQFNLSLPTNRPNTTVTLPPVAATAVATKAPVEVKDSSGATMILIPEGKFIMGNNSFSDEKPVHSVELASFYMDKYEVTNSQYKNCVAAGECKRPFYTNLYYAAARNNHPVVTVSWDMALTFCQWRGGSLPTEAQWEKAARGVEERTYPWGEVTPIIQYANYQGTDTKDVGSYLFVRSPYGILDLAGNVSEWVYDWYSPDYYQTVFLNNISDPTGPLISPYMPSHNYYGRVFRGGSWKTTNISELSTTYRYHLDPVLYADDLGFRCAKKASP